MKVAVIHDWLVNYAGAERVLEQIIICFPGCDLFSLIDFIPPKNRAFLKGKVIKTSFIQNLPFAKKNYRSYLPLMPIAIEQFDMTSYDLVISSSHCVAKGIITGPNQLHLCYCHSPVRYAWDLQHQYLEESNLKTGLKGFITRYILHKLRLWDCRTANGVDMFISNSKFISRRITKSYRRDSHVIYPPVDTDNFIFSSIKDEYYLTVSRLVPYKKISLIVESFSKMPNKKLIVIGEGPEFVRCQKLATPNIKLLGWQSSDVVKNFMQKAKAFIFAGEEDFGIAPLEAQACGCPVIAFEKGGLSETIIGLNKKNPTGVFFKEQNIESIISAISEFENNLKKIKPISCRKNAEKFSKKRFVREFKEYVITEYRKFKTINY
jgi:glycosyltransferase involved in cell wall biosynthesis